MDYGRLSIRSARSEIDQVVLSHINNGIGSDPSNTVALNGRGVAVFHCKLVVDESGAEVIDLGSSKGTLVNGTRVTCRRLHEGDEIAVGDFTLVYGMPAPAQRPMATALPLMEEGSRTDLPAATPPRVTTTVIQSSSTSPEAVVRLLRGSMGPGLSRPTADPGIKVPIPPTRQPVPSTDGANLQAVPWAAEPVEEGKKKRPTSTSDGLMLDVESGPHLVVCDGAAPRRVAVIPHESTRIGTHVSCQCMLPYNRRVFPQHAALALEKGTWQLRKLVPAASLWVDGRDVETAELRGGEIIHVGDIRIQFKDPTQVDVPLTRRYGLGRRIPLTPPRVEFGRLANNSPCVLAHPQVAGVQAQLDNSGPGWILRDVAGQAGVWRNTELIAGAAVQAPDIIAVGPYHYRFHGDALEVVAMPGGICLAAVEACPTLNEDEAGLSLAVYPGDLVALIHPAAGSANGLLKVLCGLAPLASGFVLMNGLALQGHDGTVPYGTGYVRQEEALPPDGSVVTFLSRTAWLQVADDVPPGELALLVDGALAAMDLTTLSEHRLTSLTPAQARRVRIAAALVTAPLVLVLEDPCQGLDASVASHLIELLRDVADRGTPVIFTTDPNRKLLWCDEVVVLASPLHVAFTGPPAAALRYFSADDLLDVTLRLASDKTPAAWAQEFRRSPAWSGHLEPRLAEIEALGQQSPGRFRNVPWRMQAGRRFQAELSRTWHSFLSSRSWLFLALTQALLCGAALSLVVPLGEEVTSSLGMPVSAFWIILLCVPWMWGYLEGLHWAPPAEGTYHGRRIESLAALMAQLGTSTAVLLLQILILMGLLRITLPYTPVAGGATTIVLLFLGVSGFGAGVLAGVWLRRSLSVVSLAAWLLVAQAAFSGGLGQPDGLSALASFINPVHWALALVVSLFTPDSSAMSRAGMFLWLVMLAVVSLAIAALARCMPPPRLKRH